jgi:hypothetical protein
VYRQIKGIESLEKNTPGNKALLLRYSGMAFQFLVAIGVAVWLGWFLDQKISIGFPLLIWLLPLIVIVGLIVKAIADTNKSNKDQ